MTIPAPSLTTWKQQKAIKKKCMLNSLLCLSLPASFLAAFLLGQSLPTYSQESAQLEATFRQALSYEQTKQYQEAVRLYESLLSDGYSPNLVLFHLGRSHYFLTDQVKALEFLNQVEPTEAIQFDLNALKGKSYFALEEFEAATKAFRQALAAEPEALGIKFLMAQAYRKMGNEDEAMSLLKAILEQKPDYAPAFLERGIIYQSRSKHAEAERNLRAYLQTVPQSEEAHHRLSQVLFRQGKTAEAEREAELHQRMLALSKKIENLRYGVRAKPEDVQLRIHLADALLQQGSHGQALELLTATIPLAPKESNLFVEIARVHAARNEFSQARAAFAHALSIAPNDFYANLYAGIFYYNQKDLQKGYKHLLTARSQNADHPEHHHYLGLIHLHRRQYDEAEDSLQEAANHKSLHPSTYYNLAQLLRQKKEIDRAIPLLETALRFNPSYRAAYEALASTYRQMGELDKANDLLEKLKALPDGGGKSN